MLTDDVQEALRPGDRSPLLVITAGNESRGDDGLGSYAAEHLTAPKPGILLLDAGSNPECILEDAVAMKPSRVVFIDAADFGGMPGEVRLFSAENLPATTLSTHAFPLSWLAALLIHDTGCAVSFVGVQARSFAFDAPLSEPVKAAADELLVLLRR